MDHAGISIDSKNKEIYRSVHHWLKKEVEDTKYVYSSEEAGRILAFEEILEKLKGVYLV